MAYLILLALSRGTTVQGVSPKQFKSVWLKTLKAYPRTQSVKKLACEDDPYPDREGNYRIIYTIRDKELIVRVLKIGDRKEVYRS